MNLKKYIQGKKHGKEANLLERKAMEDPFLQDAFDGFDLVNGDHIHAINKLEKRLAGKVEKKKNTHLNYRVLWIAASVALLIGFGSGIYMYLNSPKSPLLTMDSSKKDKEKSNTTDTLNDTISLPPQETPLKRKTAEKEILLTMTDHDIKLHEESYLDMNMEISDAFSPEPVDEYELSAPSASIFATEAPYKDSNIMSQLDVAATKKTDSRDSQEQSKIAETFGSKEFKSYFEKNRAKTICQGEKASIKVSFYVNSSGTVQDIEILESTCDELKSELLKWLSLSPKWTSTDRKVKLDIKL